MDHASAVPKYVDVVQRNDIRMLLKPGDLVLRNGGFAMTAWGDLMIHSEDYSAFSRLVGAWRYNFPTLEILFLNSFATFDRQAELDRLMRCALYKTPHPLGTGDAADYAAYHRARDEHGAMQIARDVYAGTIAIVITNLLHDFRRNISATAVEWRQSPPLFDGHSIGETLGACANCARHGDEWARTEPKTAQQRRSIEVLSAVLQDTISRRGVGGLLIKDIPPKVLNVVSSGDFLTLESAVFSFAQNLMSLREKRRPSQ